MPNYPSIKLTGTSRPTIQRTEYFVSDDDLEKILRHYLDIPKGGTYSFYKPSYSQNDGIRVQISRNI